MRRGNALIKVGEATKEADAFEQASSSFEEVRGDSDSSLEFRAEANFKMGDCRMAVRDYAGAAFLYLETTLNFPSAVRWVPKAYEKSIRCYEQSGQTEQIRNIEKQYNDWQRKFLK